LAKRELTPEQKERVNERARAKYAQRSAEEKARKKAYARALYAKRPAEQKALNSAAARAKYAKRSAEEKALKNANTRRWYGQRSADQKERTAAYKCAYDKTAAWRKDPLHRERNRETTRLWRLKNPERVKALSRDWRDAHPVESALLTRKNYARRKRAPGRHTAADVRQLYEAQRGVCAACDAVLVAKGRGRYHVDHIMPIALGGSNWPENLQLLCPPCNMSKNAKHPDEWARRRRAA
jgi:5-methylcytosine-specific restriction endonuclease McrA